MIIVDSWIVHRGAVGDGHVLFQNKNYIQLASELIENLWYGSILREKRVSGMMV
jgi:hypothetical protein